MRTFKIFLIGCGLGLSLTGCDQIMPSSVRRLEEQAESQYRAGDYKQAVKLYESALDGTARTADIHYKIALIYDDKIKNPVGALHHFQRYLDLAPAGSNAKKVKEFIRQDEFKLETKFAGGARMTQGEGARLKNENLALRKELADLRVQLRAFKNAPSAHEVKLPTPKAGTVRTYVVQPGDTLASISRKFYKTSARWKDLQDANFNSLNGKVDLKPGQELIIP